MNKQELLDELKTISNGLFKKKDYISSGTINRAIDVIEEIELEPNNIYNMKTEELEKLCKEVLDEFPDKVNNYKLGKNGLIGLFTGEVMKRCKGQADPKETLSILMRLLNETLI